MAKGMFKDEYLVTARKWRPLKFKDIIGQEHVTQTLKNAISSGKIHHAYLFSGPRGVGKTTTARIYARSLNCLNPDSAEPCNECDSCKTILDSRSLDVIEIDGASNNSVDDIRKLRENAKYGPSMSKYKVYIIDEVHMLSTSAFNALLKTLEEPPPHLMFVFATTEAHKVPATILSRCQRFDFRRMEIDTIQKQISYIADRENIKIDEESLIAIAKKADGSMRDAQSVFDQVVAFCGTDIKYTDLADALHLIDQEFYFKISNAIHEKDNKEIFDLTNQIISRGYDLQEALGGLLEHFRNILTVKVSGSTDLIESSNTIQEKYRAESTKFLKNDLLRFMNLTAETLQAIKYSPQPRIRFELALLRMAAIDSAIEISKLIKELKEIKKKGLIDINSIPETKPTPQIDKKKEEKVKNISYTEPIDNNQTNNKANGQKVELEVTNGTTNAAYLESKWEVFVEQSATTENDLAVLSNDFIKPIFHNGEIILGVESQFIADSVDKKLHKIIDAVAEFYKNNINIKIFVGANDSIPIKADTINYTSENKEKKEDTSSKNIVEKKEKEELSVIEEAIIEMFEAREIKTN